MKRKLSILLCLVLVVSAFALVLAACDNDNKPSGEEITLQVWGAEEDQDFLKEVAEAYQAANPDKTYDFLFGKQSESDAADKLLNDIETGADVFAFASDQLNKLIRGSALARLGDSILAEVEQNNTAESVEACSVTIGGEKRTYAMPFTDNTFYLYYDKRAGFTESDLATLDGILAKCTKDKQFAYPMEDSWYLSAFYFGKGLGYEVTYNENLGEDAITCDFDCADGLAVTNAVYEYIKDERMNPQSSDSVLVAGFKSGNIIAGASGLWNVKALKEAIGEENLGYAPLPTYTLNGEQVQMRPFAGYKCIGVNRQSKQPVEAQKFALFLTNYESQVKRFESRGYSPTNKEAMNLDKIKNDACVKAIQQQLPFCKPQAGVPTTFWSPIQGLGTAMVNSVVKPGNEAFDAQTQLTAAINQIIKAAA